MAQPSEPAHADAVQPEKAPKVIKAIRTHLDGLKKGDSGLFLKAGKSEL